MLFEDLVTDHGDAMLRLAYVLTGDRHRAEDLTQGALIVTE
jgi:DNA-directed RNA polymerase specialized sigma24 family protein